MRKIQLTDGLPSSIRKQEVSEEVKSLCEVIKKACQESRCTYVEVNKALYLADTELYAEKINS